MLEELPYFSGSLSLNSQKGSELNFHRYVPTKRLELALYLCRLVSDSRGLAILLSSQSLTNLSSSMVISSTSSASIGSSDILWWNPSAQFRAADFASFQDVHSPSKNGGLLRLEKVFMDSSLIRDTLEEAQASTED